MAIEYKKLFLVKDKSKIKISKEFIKIEQFYMAFYPNPIRCRNNNGMMTLNTKIALNNGRFEYGKDLTKEEYELLKDNRVSKLLIKERHEVWLNGCPGLYDIYTSGIELELLSFEFSSKEEMDNFYVPEWLDETDGVLYTPEDLKKED